MDIFSGWENYIERLQENWKKKICNDDTVVVAGDISWASTLDDSLSDFKFLELLPGKKVIMRGNHDYWWSTKRKVELFFKENNFLSLHILHNCAIPFGKYCICGTRGWTCFPETAQDKKILSREIGRLKISLDFAKNANLKPIVFLHYPPICNSNASSQVVNLLIQEGIDKCYYGHIHGDRFIKNRSFTEYRDIKFGLLSADSLNFEPIKIV
jgi:predicted phosphohydrolase